MCVCVYTHTHTHIYSAQFSLSVMFNSLWPHRQQQDRPPIHHQFLQLTQTHVHQVNDAIQTSHPVFPFSSRRQSFPASGSFPMSLFFTSGGQSTGASASASILPMNMQDQFPLGLTGWISLQSKGLSRVFSNTTVQRLRCSAFFTVQLSHPYMTTGKTRALTRWTFLDKVMCLLFNMLSRLIIAFLPRSKCLNFMAAVTICSDIGAPQNSLSLFPLFPYLFAMKWWNQMPWS